MNAKSGDLGDHLTGLFLPIQRCPYSRIKYSLTIFVLWGSAPPRWKYIEFRMFSGSWSLNFVLEESKVSYYSISKHSDYSIHLLVEWKFCILYDFDRKISSYNRFHNVGHSIEPWGTPLFTSIHVEVKLPVRVYYKVPERILDIWMQWAWLLLEKFSPN